MHLHELSKNNFTINYLDTVYFNLYIDVNENSNNIYIPVNTILGLSES